MARRNNNKYRKCGFCSHLFLGCVTPEGRICEKDFITSSDTDATECHYFEFGNSFSCRKHGVMYIKACLSRQDLRTDFCSRSCGPGKEVRKLFEDYVVENGISTEHKCKNPLCPAIVPAYKDYCGLDCWSGHRTNEIKKERKSKGEVSIYHKPKLRRLNISQQEVVAPESKPSKLRRRELYV